MRDLLLLCNCPARGANADTIIDHIDSIKAMPGFRVWEVSMIGDIPSTLDIDRFDVIGIHYSLHVSDPRNHFLSLKSIGQIAKFKGVKCIWMHDEYRRVDETIVKLNTMGVDVIFTVIPEETASRIYTKALLPDTCVETILTGYVSKELRHVDSPAFGGRGLDVVYRARQPPFWLGSFARDKFEIGRRFLEKASGSDLKTDISVEEWDRIYGKEWLKFLSNSKAALSVESGASIVDFTGDVERAVDQYVANHPGAEFEDVRHLIDPYEDKYSIKCISPRIFEIAACRTLIVAFPGAYSGVIEPWVHYIPLNKDFSNFREVVDILRNQQENCSKIVERAYQDLIKSGKYDYEKFSLSCAQKIPHRQMHTLKYGKISFYFDLHLSINYLLHNYFAFFFQKFILRTQMRKHLISGWSVLPKGVQSAIRPLMRYIGR